MKTEARICVISTSDIEAHHSELTDLEFIHIARKREGVYTLSQFAEEFNKGVLSGLSIENDYIRIIDIEISTIKNYDLVTAIYIADEEGYDHLLQQVGKIEHDLDWDELSKGKTVWNTKIGSITIELQESDGVKVLCYIDDKDNGETCFAFENDVGYIVSCTLEAIKRLCEQVTQVTSKIVAE